MEKGPLSFTQAALRQLIPHQIPQRNDFRSNEEKRNPETTIMPSRDRKLARSSAKVTVSSVLSSTYSRVVSSASVRPPIVLWVSSPSSR